MFQWCFIVGLRAFKGGLNGVSRVFQGYFNVKTQVLGLGVDFVTTITGAITKKLQEGKVLEVTHIYIVGVKQFDIPCLNFKLSLKKLGECVDIIRLSSLEKVNCGSPTRNWYQYLDNFDFIFLWI